MEKDNTIRVGELIECLNKMPKDARVAFRNEEDEDDMFKLNCVTLESQCYPGDEEPSTYVVLSYDDDVDDYEDRVEG